jgi:predicted dienelactone hydrolase
LGGSNEKCSYLGLAWAAQGFVSVHVQHPGIDDQVWKLKIRPVKELKDVYYQHRSGRTQANDIRFVLNQLDWLSANGTSFGQVLDMSRVGVAGYDLGGLAAMLVAGQLPPDRGSGLRDPRVKAIIVMSPPVADQMTYPPDSYGAMSTPALFFTGTEDDGFVGTTKAWQRRIPFDYMQGQDRFLITYQNAGHSIYSGHIRPIKSLDDQKYQANVAQASTLFWRAYLREESAVYAWFHGRSLGTIVGMLGRIERRLGGNTDSEMSVVTVQPETHEQAFAPAPPSLDTMLR